METSAKHSKAYEFIRKVINEFRFILVSLLGIFTCLLSDNVDYTNVPCMVSFTLTYYINEVERLK